MYLLSSRWLVQQVPCSSQLVPLCSSLLCFKLNYVSTQISFPLTFKCTVCAQLYPSHYPEFLSQSEGCELLYYRSGDCFCGFSRVVFTVVSNSFLFKCKEDFDLVSDSTDCSGEFENDLHSYNITTFQYFTLAVVHQALSEALQCDCLP